MGTSAALIKARDNDAEFQAIVDRRRAARMAEIDRLSPDLRALVNEYGYTVVKTLLDVGVKKAKQIRHVVETVLNEFSPTRGSYSRQGIRTEIGAHPSAAAIEHLEQRPSTEGSIGSKIG